MTDLNDAFETDSLLIGEGSDLAGIVAGATDPSVAGQEAPLGSFYMRTNGQQFKKTGPGNMDWSETDTGGGGGGGDLPFYNRAGAAEFIAIVVSQLPFFNRAGASENIGII